MHPNEKLIEIFYTSFQKLDAGGMLSCYHQDIRFSDPVFPLLSEGEVGGMWRMLCSQAKNFELTFTDVQADERMGKAHWEARYKFSATGRSVHNKIDARFEFQDGKIIKHTDEFDFWKWSRMALGPVGSLLGWTPLLRKKVRNQARARLERFMKSQTAADKSED
ncbi:MAG TPA: nuclear transport factor 2 family protein [Pyrinomonadaceae bacterium]|nr:nuclear transport factor 2 family protein [Pyrinomonadaceae bacterium]